MNSKTILKFLLAAVVGVMTACSDMGPKWEYLVDNPLDKEITINIDGKNYNIPANTTETIELSQGKHTLTYDGNSVNFVTKVNSNKSVTLMNPTLSNYILHANIYVRKGARNNGQGLYEQNSREYNSAQGVVKLPVKVINDLFMDKAHHRWTFGLEQDAKEKVSTSNPGKQTVFYKLYRQKDYLKDFAKELPAGIEFPVNSKKLNEQPAYVFPVESFTSDCEEANKGIKELETRWQKAIANPADIFQDVGKLSYDFTATLNKEWEKACGTQYNPGRDETQLNNAIKKLHSEMRYLTSASTFIVK